MQCWNAKQRRNLLFIKNSRVCQRGGGKNDGKNNNDNYIYYITPIIRYLCNNKEITIIRIKTTCLFLFIQLFRRVGFNERRYENGENV